MGLFKSLKGDHPKSIGDSNSQRCEDYAPPPGPPPPCSLRTHQLVGSSASQEYQPPPGPPPGRETFAPPSGPPPSHPKASDSPPPYHDWTVIPDNSLLPPPPTLGHEDSPSGNASSVDADRARDFCYRYPIMRPHQPTPEQHASVQSGDVRLIKPREYRGELLMLHKGAWRGSTRSGSRDACLLTSFPIYFAHADSPMLTKIRKTIYYEVKIRSLGLGRGNNESAIALGYAGIPYPTWRMPGWQRASLAVHGDDGRKYINDPFGGKDFTSPYREGSTIGIGMTFTIPDGPPEYGAPQEGNNPIKTEIFLTRDGRRVAGWDLHEQTDAETDGPIDGLEGNYDLFGAIGVFGGVEFDVFFSNRDWLWRPS
ncbi:MAG: hypothetical protein Q9191_004042 [Dirinaria sp. TL-2023a]